MPLDRALAKAFTYNSANPNVAASASAPGPGVASGSIRRAKTLSDSGGVDVITSPTKRSRTHARAQATSNRNHNHSAVLPRVSPHKKRKRQHMYTLTSPPRKQQRIAHGGDPSDERGQDDSDDEVEIVVDAPRRAQKPKPQPQLKHKLRRANQQHRASTPPAAPTFASVNTSPASTPSPSPPASQPSSPATPPDVNSLAGLPLTILPAPARREIVIPTLLVQSSRLGNRHEIARDATTSDPAGFFAMRGPHPARTVSSRLSPPLSNTHLHHSSCMTAAALAPPHLTPVCSSSTQVWIFTRTSTYLWANNLRMNPRMRTRSSISSSHRLLRPRLRPLQLPLHRPRLHRPRLRLPRPRLTRCCAPRAPMTILTDLCLAF